MQTKAVSNGHELILDEPAKMGGQDQGTNPLGNMLVSLAGCENIVANIVSKELAFDLQGIEFQISGEFDPRGLMGDPNVRTYFQKITIHAKVKTNESDERIQELKRLTDKRCPVYGILKAADVEIEAHWEKA
ncbi:OsmC family protein [Bacillus tianshenii]|nr:OsmC family protein [Bacillus tianshenii]